MIEDTAANVRPIIRETSRLPQSYSVAVGAKRKKCTSTAGRASGSATAFISAFSAKFSLRVIWLSAVRVGVLFQGKSMRKSIAGNGADANHHASGRRPAVYNERSFAAAGGLV